MPLMMMLWRSFVLMMMTEAVGGVDDLPFFEVLYLDIYVSIKYYI